MLQGITILRRLGSPKVTQSVCADGHATAIAVTKA
jgi:hypothetical protein